MMPKGLNIPICHDNEITMSMTANHEGYSLQMCDVRELMFYQIDAVGIFVDINDGNRDYGEIYSSGKKFISIMPQHQLINRIEKHLKALIPLTLS